MISGLGVGMHHEVGTVSGGGNDFGITVGWAFVGNGVICIHGGV